MLASGLGKVPQAGSLEPTEASMGAWAGLSQSVRVRRQQTGEPRSHSLRLEDCGKPRTCPCVPLCYAVTYLLDSFVRVLYRVIH